MKMSSFSRYAGPVVILLLVGLLLLVGEHLISVRFQQNSVTVKTHGNRQANVSLHDNGCRLSDIPSFIGQNLEDLALFVHYFAAPLVCHGTFVELGAYDGLSYSNTKFFEDYLGWTGVLVEAEPGNAAKVMQNRPHTKNFPMAVCPEGQKTTKFIGRRGTGGIEKHMTKHHREKWIPNGSKAIDVPCEPMSTILKKAGVTKVDLFSLDVEGGELMVLQTMDWSILVRVFVIEMNHGDDEEIIQFLGERGYKKADWDIRHYCYGNGHCLGNVVFENTIWPTEETKTM